MGIRHTEVVQLRLSRRSLKCIQFQKCTMHELIVAPISNTLASTTQKLLNYGQHAATHTNGPQLIEMANMADNGKCSTEVHLN